MKYMLNGGVHSNPLIPLTIGLTMMLMSGFIVTNFALYFSRMDLSPSSVVRYYNGSEEEFHQPRSYQAMLEVTHGHLAMMALVLLLLTHLAIFAPLPIRWKTILIVVAFLSGLLSEGSGWGVRFLDPAFAWLKVSSFLALQLSLIVLIVLVAGGLFARRDSTADA